MRNLLLILAAGFLFSGHALATGASVAPPPPNPQAPSWTGTITAEVTFGGDGRATSCKIVEGSAPTSLEVATKKFILKNWRTTRLAGKTVMAPIVFKLTGGAPPG